MRRNSNPPPLFEKPPYREPAASTGPYSRPEIAQLDHLCGGIHHALQQLRTVPYRQLACIHVETARLLLQRVEEIACPNPDTQEDHDVPA